MKKIFLLIFLLSISLMFFGTSSALAVNHYIRPNGGNYGVENGSDWNNAFDGFPANLTRGDTYYIAGGSYNMDGYLFDDDDSKSGSTYIYIKKASVDGICDATTGWNASYATTQAVLSNSTSTAGTAIDLRNGYYEFDGVTGNGNSGQGILIKAPDNKSALTSLFLVYTYGNLSNVNFKHIAFEGLTEVEGGGSGFGSVSLIYAAGVSAGKYTANFVYQDCHFKSFQEAINILGENSDNVLVDHCYFEGHWGNSYHHGQVFDCACGDELICRSNIFKGVDSSAGINVHLKMTDLNCSQDDFEIYNNIFFGGDANVVIGSATSTCTLSADGWKIYNNTIVNHVGKIYMPIRSDCGAYTGTYPATNWEVKNNLYYNVTGSNDKMGINYQNNYWNTYKSGVIPLTATNSIISTENIYTLFPNYNLNDFHIGENSEARNAGIDLGSPYDIDLNGNIRGADGNWDIGAYEYTGNIPPDLIPPSNPTGLSVI